MARFKNPEASHEHSLKVLNLLYEYDSFLDSLRTIADMGCGAGLDSQWWATLYTRDDPPEPHDYLVYAVEQNRKEIYEQVLKDNEKVVPIIGNFEEPILPGPVDLMWAHDSFQYARDPFKCLATWKAAINHNGMLVLSIPQSTYFYNNRLIVENRGEYYNYNLLNLIYMLAVSGFDCRDAYFYREANTPWLYAAVYASEHKPLLPGASWYELAERQLINDSVIDSVNKYGHARLEDILVAWLDKDFYQISN